MPHPLRNPERQTARDPRALPGGFFAPRGTAGKLTAPRIPLSGLLLGYLFLVLDVDLSLGLSPYDEKRLLQLCLITAALAVLVVSAQGRSRIITTAGRLPRSARLGISALFALGIGSALSAFSPIYGLVELALLGALLLLALAMAAPDADLSVEREITLACWLLAATAGVYELKFLVAYSATLLADAKLLPLELLGNLYSVKLLNQLQTWTLPLLTLGMLLAKGRPGVRMLLAVIAAGWWMLVWVSGARGTLLGQAVAILAVIFLFGAAARPWLKAHLALAAAGALAFGVLFILLPELGAPGTHEAAKTGLDRDLTSSSGRVSLWTDSLALVRGAPLMGIGPMHFVCEQVHQARLGGSPHNILLQLAVEWGLPAAILFLTLAGWAAIGWTRWSGAEVRRGDERAVLVSLSASLYAAAAHSMVSSLFIAPMSQVMLIVVAGWALRLRLGDVNMPSHPRSHRGYSRVALTLAVLAVIVILGWGAGSVTNAHALLMEALTRGEGPVVPRLWMYGLICTAP